MKTKKILSIFLAAVMGLSFVACSGDTKTPESSAPEESSTSEASTEAPATDGEGFELALITDLGTIDDKSFNQGSWEGLVQYAEEKGISHKYYQPSEQSDDAYLSGIELAVAGGAKVIVTPGFLFETPIFLAQDIYPDVKFILVDGVPHNADYSEFRTEANVVGLNYAEEQAGFLAGYAAVKDGYTNLGFMGGMAVPAVVRFGYGFVQGAEYAATELGLPEGSITMNYHYTGDFAATPEAQSMAASWYDGGTQVIFACGGAVGNSVMAAAEQSGGKVIGVDVDQSSESETVITSAMKGLKVSVYDSIKANYEGSFPGGQTQVYGAENDGIGLPMETSRFETFSQADYDAIYAELKAGKIEIMRDQDASSKEVKVTDIPVKAIVLSEI